MAKFYDEASIHIGKDSVGYDVVVFGGTQKYHKDGNLLKNYQLSKSFKKRSKALTYYKYLVRKYNKFVAFSNKIYETDLEKESLMPIIQRGD